MPKFAEPLYAAAAEAACQCKKEPEVQKQCSPATTTSGADLFCKPYMKCLIKHGEEDGKQYASSGKWLPFEKLNLGTASTCTASQVEETYRRRALFH
jgi:hypothetical protein